MILLLSSQGSHCNYEYGYKDISMLKMGKKYATYLKNEISLHMYNLPNHAYMDLKSN